MTMTMTARANRVPVISTDEEKYHAHDMVARGFLDNHGAVTLDGDPTTVEHVDCHVDSYVGLMPKSAAAAAVAVYVVAAGGQFAIHGGTIGHEYKYMVLS